MKTLTTTLFIFLMSFTSWAQMITVSGTVIDDTGLPLAGANITIKNTTIGTQTDWDGNFSIHTSVGDTLVFAYVGFITFEKQIASTDTTLDVQMQADAAVLDEVIVAGYATKRSRKRLGYAIRGSSSIRGNRRRAMKSLNGTVAGVQVIGASGAKGAGTEFKLKYGQQVSENESYAKVQENIFKRVGTAPLSTFSIDVDKAGYSNVRRMLNNGQKVPKDAVKIEEMVNYFKYDYPAPTGEHPFSITTDVAQSPWNKDSKLVRIALKGKEIDAKEAPSSNLVFLIDVSGSMASENKLGLLKSAFGVLVDKLRETDKVSIVVYAGAAGMVLEPTSGIEKERIMAAVQNLQAGGSTAGGQGIKLAYKVAKENFIEGGNNRVILATDGDFNVGASSDRAMEDLIVEKRESGIFLTVLGFGMGNYKDSKMETLADKGNGNHAYVDSMQEAKKVLGEEFFGTIYTIAKDVKIQVEFNPSLVQAYRLIGYENRLLNDEDFNDDTKDAGELGSGHTVTALYEVILNGVESPYVKKIDDLKYSALNDSGNSNELLTVKFRYKEPDGDTSKLITKTLLNSDQALAETSADFQFAAAVALFGQQLRKSVFIDTFKISDVVALAEAGRGTDKRGYRAEFIRLVESANIFD